MYYAHVNCGAGAPRAYDNELSSSNEEKIILMLLYEEIHDARIIPIDGSPPHRPELSGLDGRLARSLGRRDTALFDVTNFETV